MRESARAVVALLAVAGGVRAMGQSYEVVYRTGNFISGVGVITSPFRNGRPGFHNAAINNSGQMWVHAGMIGNEGFDEVLLNSGTGLSPYLVEGNDLFPLGAPSEDHVVDAFAAVSVNNAGVGGFAFTTKIVDFPLDPAAVPTSGVYLGDGVILIEEGDVTGFDAGSVWDPMSAGMTVRVNDANQWLIGHSVTDGGGAGVSRRVIVRVQSDAAGANLGETVIAEEGGFVAGGLPGETWAELSVAPHAVAMNAAGSVLFTGRTSAGREGVFLNGAFVALTGGAAPGAAGQVWGELLGAAVDLNNVGAFVVRGVVASDGTWVEGGGAGGDAGEDASEAFEGDREITGGGGALSLISGMLGDDHDVDVYKIRITDPAAFSATTVGGPTAFDSVLWLLQTGHNFNGVDRTGLGRNDDADGATALSRLGSTNVPGVGDYYLCVSTGKARAVSTYPDDFARGVEVEQDLWQRDPSSLTLGLGGRVWWADPSEGLLRTVTPVGAVGTAGPSAVVAATPTVPELTGAEIVSPVAFDVDAGAPGGGWTYFVAESDTSVDGDGIRRVSADGAVIQDVVASLDGASGVSALAIDEGRGKVYWSRRQFGQVWRANSDGSGPEMLVGAAGSGALVELAEADVVTAIGLAVDEATGDLFAADPHRDSIVRVTFPAVGAPVVTDFVSSVPVGGGCACETDGAAGVDVFDLLAFLDLWFVSDAGADIDGAAGVDVFDLLFFLDCWFPASAGAPCGGGGGSDVVAAAGVAIDQISREVYFTHPGDARVLKAALAGGSAGDAVEVIGAGGAPGAHAIAVDGAAGKVYWTDIDGRKIRRANLDGSGSGVYFDIGPAASDSTADGDFGKRAPFSAWAKRGAASGPAIPYEIRLTGASYALEGAMIAKNNTEKVVAFGDLLDVPVVTDPNTTPPTTMLVPTRVNYIGRTGQPVRISDNGDVLWLGEWGGFGFDEGLFLNQTVTLSSVATPAEITSVVITTIDSGANALDMSDDGRWATVRVTDGRFVAGNQAQIRIDFGP